MKIPENDKITQLTEMLISTGQNPIDKNSTFTRRHNPFYNEQHALFKFLITKQILLNKLAVPTILEYIQQTRFPPEAFPNHVVHQRAGIIEAGNNSRYFMYGYALGEKKHFSETPTLFIGLVQHAEAIGKKKVSLIDTEVLGVVYRKADLQKDVGNTALIINKTRFNVSGSIHLRRGKLYEPDHIRSIIFDKWSLLDDVEVTSKLFSEVTDRVKRGKFDRDITEGTTPQEIAAIQDVIKKHLQ